MDTSTNITNELTAASTLNIKEEGQPTVTSIYSPDILLLLGHLENEERERERTRMLFGEPALKDSRTKMLFGEPAFKDSRGTTRNKT